MIFHEADAPHLACPHPIILAWSGAAAPHTPCDIKIVGINMPSGFLAHIGGVRDA